MTRLLQIANNAISLLHLVQLIVNLKLVAIDATRKEERMDKLKERIDSRFETRAKFAEAIGVEPYTLSRMLSSGNWKADRIEAAVKVLKIPAKEIPSYFFPQAVANKAPEEIT